MSFLLTASNWAKESIIFTHTFVFLQRKTFRAAPTQAGRNKYLQLAGFSSSWALNPATLRLDKTIHFQAAWKPGGPPCPKLCDPRLQDLKGPLCVWVGAGSEQAGKSLRPKREINIQTCVSCFLAAMAHSSPKQAKSIMFRRKETEVEKHSGLPRVLKLSIPRGIQQLVNLHSPVLLSKAVSPLVLRPTRLTLLDHAGLCGVASITQAWAPFDFAYCSYSSAGPTVLGVILCS